MVPAPHHAPAALLWLAHGERRFLHQTEGSIGSLLDLCPAGVRAAVYTDDPAFFVERFGARVECRPVDAAGIARWRGDIDFVHLVKVRALADWLDRERAPVLYVDGDTLFMRDPRPLLDAIARGRLALHAPEGAVDASEEPIFRRLAAVLERDARDAGPIGIPPASPMWNAGCVGIDPARRALLDEVAARTEALYRACPVHVAEQLAFSHAFAREGEVLACAGHVAHYWSDKRFAAIAVERLAGLAGADAGARVAAVRELRELMRARGRVR